MASSLSAQRALQDLYDHGLMTIHFFYGTFLQVLLGRCSRTHAMNYYYVPDGDNGRG